MKPALADRELAWMTQQLSTYPPRGVFTMVELQELPLAIGALRSWAQLRLQGQLTVRGQGPLRADACPFCGAASRPGLQHLICECPTADGIVRPQLCDSRWNSRTREEVVALINEPQCAEDLTDAVRLCGALRQTKLLESE